MANIYYEAHDLSRSCTDPKHAVFGSQSHNQDLAGVVVRLARENGTEPENIRLFVYATKRQWDERRNRFSCQMDWSQRDANRKTFDYSSKE